jgi:hypothetical protein
MSTIEIILLLGVAGLWTGLVFAAIAVLRISSTVGRLEYAVDRLQRDVSALLPRIGSTLQEVELTSAELTKTAASARTFLETSSRDSMRDAAVGALKYLPIVVGVARTIVPLLVRRKK